MAMANVDLIQINWPGMRQHEQRVRVICPFSITSLREATPRTRRELVTQCHLTNKLCDHSLSQRVPSHCPLLAGISARVIGPSSPDLLPTTPSSLSSPPPTLEQLRNEWDSDPE